MTTLSTCPCSNLQYSVPRFLGPRFIGHLSNNVYVNVSDWPTFPYRQIGSVLRFVAEPTPVHHKETTVYSFWSCCAVPIEAVGCLTSFAVDRRNQDDDGSSFEVLHRLHVTPLPYENFIDRRTALMFSTHVITCERVLSYVLFAQNTSENDWLGGTGGSLPRYT